MFGGMYLEENEVWGKTPSKYDLRNFLGDEDRSRRLRGSLNRPQDRSNGNGHVDKIYHHSRNGYQIWARSKSAIYRLLDHDLEAFTTKDCELGVWLASMICPRKNLPMGHNKGLNPMF
ncbi:hypothetical protein H5410_003659 [Solanum commersonii]|uniref:Uncharacterized protein n=1 Tax=Solanum commersonii TaxID=4109 RepID=A0A9J6B5C4_SOLCO|nr:hypothetical protein H5410_003659 [Solanum commersonii]